MNFPRESEIAKSWRASRSMRRFCHSIHERADRDDAPSQLSRTSMPRQVRTPPEPRESTIPGTFAIRFVNSRGLSR